MEVAFGSFLSTLEEHVRLLIQTHPIVNTISHPVDTGQWKSHRAQRIVAFLGLVPLISGNYLVLVNETKLAGQIGDHEVPAGA